MLTREQVAGCRATIKTDPKPNRRWRESIFVSALDSIDFLEGKLSSCESCLAEAEREVERLKSLMQQVRREIHEQGHVSSGSWASMLHVEGLLNSEGRAGT